MKKLMLIGIFIILIIDVSAQYCGKNYKQALMEFKATTKTIYEINEEGDEVEFVYISRYGFEKSKWVVRNGVVQKEIYDIKYISNIKEMSNWIIYMNKYDQDKKQFYGLLMSNNGLYICKFYLTPYKHLMYENFKK